jgi:thiol:disulfide interchange protein DsbD
MIPILSGIIVAQGQEATKIRSFLLSLTYVLGMALTYAAAGVAAGLSGRLIAAALQNPWVLGGFALIFVALALSMFGWYDLQLPGSFLGKMTTAGNKQKAGTFLGVFIMGVLSGLIIGPCVTAPLAGALVYISRHQDVWLGGTALFSLALGMGVPLLILGTSAGFLLPRAGEWMMAIKAFFGWILLGVAVWIVSPVIPGPVALFLWGALLITGSIYLNSLDPLPVPAGGWAKFRKGIGVLILLIGLILVLGAFTGGTDPFRPLSGLLSPSQPAMPGEGVSGSKETQALTPYASRLTPQTRALAFQTVTGLGELEEFFKEPPGRPLMLYVGADWCTACKELERFTFADPKVQQALKGLALIKADVTRDNEQTRALLKKFGLFGPPAVLFFDGKGEEIPGTRVIGVQKAGEFMVSLTKIIIPDLSQ